jgi:hypothetical protein
MGHNTNINMPDEVKRLLLLLFCLVYVRKCTPPVMHQFGRGAEEHDGAAYRREGFRLIQTRMPGMKLPGKKGGGGGAE